MLSFAMQTKGVRDKSICRVCEFNLTESGLEYFFYKTTGSVQIFICQQIVQVWELTTSCYALMQ